MKVILRTKDGIEIVEDIKDSSVECIRIIDTPIRAFQEYVSSAPEINDVKTRTYRRTYERVPIYLEE